MEAAPTRPASVSSAARTSGSVPGNARSSTTARRYRTVPPDSNTPRPRARASAIASRHSAWKRATLNGSEGSATSMRWCGTRARSSGVGLAVPTSIPR